MNESLSELERFADGLKAWAYAYLNDIKAIWTDFTASEKGPSK